MLFKSKSDLYVLLVMYWRYCSTYRVRRRESRISGVSNFQLIEDRYMSSHADIAPYSNVFSRAAHMVRAQLRPCLLAQAQTIQTLV